MAPLGKNKGNESIKDTPDRCVPHACGLYHVQSTQNKAVEKELADPISFVGMPRIISTFLINI